MVCLCSSWSLQQSLPSPSGAALPCQLGSTGCWFWRCLLSRTSAFDSALPWCCSGKTHSIISQEPVEEEERRGCVCPPPCPVPHVVSEGCTPCWRAGKWLPHLQGCCVLREGGQRCHWMETHGSLCYMVLFWVLHWCCTSEVLALVLMSVGMAVVDLCVCWLGHLAPPIYFAFFTAGSLLCVLLRGSSEEDKWKQKHNTKKKISLYDRIQITVMVKCFSAIHTWNSFFCALSLPRIPSSELQCVFIIEKLWKDLSL